MGIDTTPFHFAGFDSPNTTPVPDIFFDLLAPNLTESELRVLIYIMRRTFGFKKQQDNISLKQMVEGICTRDGIVLDSGTGMSKPGVTKGVKGLVQKGVVVATRNNAKNGADTPTTYRLRFRHDDSAGGLTSLTPGGKARFLSPVNVVAPQETVPQETEKQGFDHSNGHPAAKPVDTLGITGYLDNLILDISREFGDTGHLASNCKQARNILTELDIAEDVFVERYVYAARQRTKHQAKIRAKMPYFFRVLRDSVGLEPG